MKRPLGLRDRLKEIARFAAGRAIVAFDLAMRIVQPRRPKVVWETHGGDRELPRRSLMIYAHFDRDGAIHDYVVYCLDHMREAGCDIIFVSTAPGLTPAEAAKVHPYCRAIIARENIGHDFGSWKTGLERASALSGYDRLILASDASYGPLFSFTETLHRMAGRNLDFWGVTDSWRFGHHIQSYFTVFERPVLGSSIFASFWRRLPYYRFRHSVIHRGELRLSRLLGRAGFRFGALCPYEGVYQRHDKEMPAARASARIDVDASLWCWDTLIEHFQCPFIKVRPLRDDPFGTLAQNDWREVISAHTDYDVGLIERHLGKPDQGTDTGVAKASTVAARVETAEANRLSRISGDA